MGCCHTEKKSDCHDHGSEKKKSFDFILWGSVFAIGFSFVAYIFLPDVEQLGVFSDAAAELLHSMWWGIVLGVVFVGFMSKVPKEYFTAVLGQGDTFGGVVRATIAGLFLDMCSHGIVLVAAKLYERGASLAQVMAFLIASPWNSLSLTFILIALVGLKWTLLYILGSAVIAIVTGVLYQKITAKGALPANPNSVDLPDNFSIREDMKTRLSGFRPDATFFKEVATGGFSEAKMLLRWLLLGVVIAASIRTFMPEHLFAEWFGPTLLGLGLTLVATTLIEVCSEGSAPIASEIVHRAGAPGNGFAFLMAGVATDYTEIMVIREFSKSWKVALSLPLLTVPQVIVIGYIMNVMGAG